MEPAAPTIGHLLTICLFGSLNSLVGGSCIFPKYLQRPNPWVGDYKDGRIIAYVKPAIISLIESNIKFSRECVQKTSDNKFLVMHREENESVKFLCMQFVSRGDNIIQIKTSNVFTKQNVEICEDSGMALDPFPLVSSGQTPENHISCPFTGGYNMQVYYAHPNNSLVCNNLMLYMRMESECDRGEGITFDFRRDDCVPNGLPRSHKQRARCVAHWTQDSYTFIILQHVDFSSQWFCLRTTDPLNNIRSAYLWLKVICDTSEIPSPQVSHSYLRLELTKRIFSSTCNDELELCPGNTHYCNMELSRHCAHTCKQCKTENDIGTCTFGEQYRGRWMESSNHSEHILDVEAYSVISDQTGTYNCLNLGSDKMPHKKVLLELHSNGCFPRYTCVEMEKITSSVMKFRFGDRLTWPLRSMKNQKEDICTEENFRTRDQHSPYFMKERPARLLVNVGNIREVNCGLPEHLQRGIAFREDGKLCGGCLNYEPQISPNHFTVSPVNCSESGEKQEHRNVPLQYSCLATFHFHNNTVAVVTKTTNYPPEMGQYLVWIFTPENHIKVLKAADTFLFEQNPAIPSTMFQVQFSILRNDNLQCRNFVFLPRSTTTTTRPTAHGSLGNHPNDQETLYITGTFPGTDHLTYNPKNGYRPETNPATDTPRFENSKKERIIDSNSSTRCFTLYLNLLVRSVLLITVLQNMT
ncbi:hypothetical protein BsWGS_21684 [Bradybaena similaris]